MNALERKAAVLGLLTAIVMVLGTFAAGAIYRNDVLTLQKQQSVALMSKDHVAAGRAFFLQSCAHCHGQDADGGEDGPSLQKLQISAAHMHLVITSGVKDEMPSFARRYKEAEITRIISYLETLR